MLIEKEFAIVIYGDKIFIDGEPNHHFITSGPGLSAKMPPDIIGDRKVENDSNMILQKINNFIND